MECSGKNTKNASAVLENDLIIFIYFAILVQIQEVIQHLEWFHIHCMAHIELCHELGLLSMQHSVDIIVQFIQLDPVSDDSVGIDWILFLKEALREGHIISFYFQNRCLLGCD